MRPSSLAQRLRSRLLRQPGITAEPTFACAACEKRYPVAKMRRDLCIYCDTEYQEYLADQRALHPDEPMPEPGPFLEDDD